MLPSTLSPLVDNPAAALIAPRDRAIDALLRNPIKLHADTPDIRSARSAVWSPPSAQRIRAVETLMVVGIMAYFAYGVASAFGIF